MRQLYRKIYLTIIASLLLVVLVAALGDVDRFDLERLRRLTAPHRAAAEPAPEPDANVRRLETELGEKLGARVTFKLGARGRGQLIISYSSLEELDGILAHIH